MYFLNRYKRGIANRYRKGMPVSEMVTKDLGHFWAGTKLFFRNRMKRKVMLVYPHYPSKKSTIYKVATRLGYEVTNNPSTRAEIAIYWEYLTVRTEFKTIEKVAERLPVINLHSRDIGKKFVDSHFHKVFGYSSQVDPLTYEGALVQKNDINALHDGKIVQGPLKKKEPGYIYQLLIDTSVEGGLVMDLRVMIIGGLLDFAYKKYRPVGQRFENINVNTEIVPVTDIFSSQEIEQINAFCKEIKLEYGELDILRHWGDNRIYIVDVNNTPHGPHPNATKEQVKFIVSMLSSKFREVFLKEAAQD